MREKPKVTGKDAERFLERSKLNEQKLIQKEEKDSYSLEESLEQAFKEVKLPKRNAREVLNEIRKELIEES